MKPETTTRRNHSQIWRGLICVSLFLLSPFSLLLLRAQSSDSLCSRQLPWETSFEANEGSLQCWQVVDECLGYPTVMQNYAATGELSLAMTSVSAQQRCMIATPQLMHRADSLHVTFHLTMAAGSGTLQVGVWDDSVFTPMLTIVNAGDVELGRYEFYTDGLARADSLRVKSPTRSRHCGAL